MQYLLSLNFMFVMALAVIMLFVCLIREIILYTASSFVSVQQLICVRTRTRRNTQCMVCDDISFLVSAFYNYNIEVVVSRSDLRGSVCPFIIGHRDTALCLYQQLFRELCQLQIYGISYRVFVVHLHM